MRACSYSDTVISEKTKKTKIFIQPVTNRGRRKFKHFTTASEVKSYQEHLQKHKLQEMITQYACNKPALWPLNIRLSAAKTRFTESKFRMLQVMHCVVLVTFARETKRKRTTVQADSQGHVSHYHELMSRVWPVNAYFLMQPATRLCGTLTRKVSLTFILFFQ